MAQHAFSSTRVLGSLVALAWCAALVSAACNTGGPVGVPGDAEYRQQWHLDNTEQGQRGKYNEDINVERVWVDDGLSGSGVVIAIVDDGLQKDNPELACNFVSSLSYDFLLDDMDPSPVSADDGHGTAAAGVAAASDDGTCGVGAAYRASLAGLRLIGSGATDADEANALTHEFDKIDIFSNSWGPADDGKNLIRPGRLTREAFVNGVENGRSGLGSIYVWAAGNGGNDNDNVNYDGYANTRYTIAVGAVDAYGEQSSYSESGSALFLVAPSSGSNSFILTSDLIGSAGYSQTGDCTGSFSGTSAACPLAAGVIALMLEQDPTLTWRDVQNILVRSTVKNDPDDDSWATNGAGIPFSHRYGFGRISAWRAVNRTKEWTPVCAEQSLEVPYNPANPADALPHAIPDGTNEVLIIPVRVSTLGLIEHVEVEVDITHPSRGTLRLQLESPSGMLARLQEVHTQDKNADISWTYLANNFWGESTFDDEGGVVTFGDWRVKIKDDVADGQAGTVNAVTLRFYGTAHTEECTVTVNAYDEPLKDEPPPLLESIGGLASDSLGVIIGGVILGVILISFFSWRRNKKRRKRAAKAFNQGRRFTVAQGGQGGQQAPAAQMRAMPQQPPAQQGQRGYGGVQRPPNSQQQRQQRAMTLQQQQQQQYPQHPQQQRGMPMRQAPQQQRAMQGGHRPSAPPMMQGRPSGGPPPPQMVRGQYGRTNLAPGYS